MAEATHPASPPSPAGGPPLERYRARYLEAIGFVPARVDARLRQLGDSDPELLALQEEVHERTTHPAQLDQKTVQLVLFGMLLSQFLDAAVPHGIAARRAGASWGELQAVANLAYLFGGQACANRAAEYLEAIADHEAPE